MGLETFETEGYRTYSEDNNDTSSPAVRGANPVGAVEFEEEWGMSMHEAEQDDEFVAQRIKEADSMTELCDMFHWLTHSVVSRSAELCNDGLLDASDVPESDHPHYNGKDITFYVEEMKNNRAVTYTGDGEESETDNTPSTTTTSSSNEDSGLSSGLSNFKS